MNFNEYQEAAASTACYADKVPDEIKSVVRMLYLSTKLGGEAGEASQKIAKLVRDKGYYSWDMVPHETKVAIAKELGGVLWYVAAIATEMGFNLENIANLNIDQLSGRVERGTLLGDGDDR